MTSDAENLAASAFIQHWQSVPGTELSNAQNFVSHLCELLGVAKPHATQDESYMFERPITFLHGDGSRSPGRIDCYRRGHFVLEAKKLKAAGQTKGFDDALLRARAQAEGYARALPAAEGRPPFLLVVDVGNVIELYAEFSKSGATYTPFPDPRSHRIKLADLARTEVRETLRKVWLEPDSLNPARASARVTREVSDQLATLAKSLEQSGHRPDHIAAFLTRALFSMFAEDVELLPKGSFLKLLQTHRAQPATLRDMLKALWADMDHGGFSIALATQILRFNGKLFKEPAADGYSLLLNQKQIDLLLLAARANWREVEPAIFGTLLERALNVTERHALGAHYTPRAYVERLVLPTVVEPLRAEWANAQASAVLLAQEAAELEANPVIVKANTKAAQRPAQRHEAKVRAKWREARQVIRQFHHRLCQVKVLDPACGSGNFLYVTLEHLKRLEGEVLNQLAELDGGPQDLLLMQGETVTPQQLLGLELNPRAAALAELVLWIGYLQWHLRTREGQTIVEPVVHDYGNIQTRDAVLQSDAAKSELAYDSEGTLLTRWDGATFKLHPVTGAKVPDDAAQVPQWKHVGARQAVWPQADFIVGNPPFIGASTMRAALGDGYVQALRACWPEVPESADFVMYWWSRAATLVASGKTQRFGLITTNSLRQTFNRRVVQAAMDSGIGLAFAIADHPWVDSANGAAVRTAMTVGERGATNLHGRLLAVTEEKTGEFGEVAVTLAEQWGEIHADLSIGANTASAHSLQANENLSNRGVQLFGKGFIVTPEEAANLGFGKDPALETVIRDYRNGRDLTGSPRGVKVIDAFGLNADELRIRHPMVFQRLLERVKPERDVKSTSKDGAGYAKLWWLHGKPRQEMRKQLSGLPRYIATVETAKHRTFQFLDASILPDNKLIAIALSDAFHLGVLSSRLHVAWSLAAGSWLGVGNDPVYVKSRCFETFPFPSDDTGLTPALQSQIANLAEQIDAHRKRVLAQHPGTLTLTGLYNVIEALREGRALSAKEKAANEQGLVSTLKNLHDELDAAVLEAYGWGDALRLAQGERGNDGLLGHLLALNARRAAEEKTGLVRWLRPAFQDALKLISPEFLSEIPSKQLLFSEQSFKISRDSSSEKVFEIDSKKDKSSNKTKKGSAQSPAWPASLPDQVRAVAQVLAGSPAPLSVRDIEAAFKAPDAAKGSRSWKNALPPILQTLEALGRARAEMSGNQTTWRSA